MYCNNEQNDWDLFIPYVLFAYRTSIHSSTKETPFFLMYGRDPKLPIEQAYLPADLLSSSNVISYREQLLTRLNIARKLVGNNIVQSQKRQKLAYDKKIQDVSFNVGEQV